MQLAEFDFRTGRYEGEVAKDNPHTIWVKVRLAGKVFTIKRHKHKHRVVLL